VKRVLLLGGGHAQVEVIRRFALTPVRGGAVTLLSPERYTAYSGMLPGFIAGHYDFEDCHIDLEPLCARAGIRFHRGAARELDPDAGIVVCSDGTELGYDLLSIDTGSTSDVHAIPGALEHGFRVKPVSELLAAWDRIQATLRGGNPLSVVVVGGGAGGVELAAAMQYRSRKNAWSAGMRLVVVADTESLLPEHPIRAQRIFERVFRQRGIEVRSKTKVTRILPGGVECDNGTVLKADYAIVATGAGAPGWITKSGLRTDNRGFAVVNDGLQTLSHPNVFAAGDAASMINAPRPKMGVYAVRQGPILEDNLRRYLRGAPLRSYLPQKEALALISTGDKHAVASRNGIAVEGDWIWRLKNIIDRRFMATYRIAPT